jgi:Flp pilus assembly protein TadG
MRWSSAQWADAEIGPASRAALGLLSRFRRDEGGATAVEFGLVATPFLALLFAILQTALVFWSTQVLETAVANASRQLYTGQFQTDPNNTTAGLTPADLQKRFKDLLCANVSGLFACQSAVSVDIRVFDSFASAAPASPVTGGVYNPSGYTYQAPGPKQIALVRASMEYPTFATIMSPATGLTNGKQLIMASATFRTEPY